MKALKINHIGIAVSDLSISIPVFEKLLGVPCDGTEEVKDQYVKVAFFHVGESKIELLESTNDEGPIAGFIAKNGEGVQHIAFEVDQVEEALAEAKNNGFRLIDRVPRDGADGLKIAFLNPKKTNNVLIEFCSNE